MIELEIVSKQIIKPSSPTPPELRNLPLCLFDQQIPNLYIQLFYFYDDDNNNIVSSSGGRHQLLKDSLSKALTFYYPFAGRLRHDGNSIDCDDTGVAFSEARLLPPCPMSEFTSDFSLERQEILRSSCREDMKLNKNPLLSVQLTEFECGGEVMFVFCSHKVADLASLANFMNDWASIARSSAGGESPVVSPQFNAADYFPPELDAGGYFPPELDACGDLDGGEEGEDHDEQVCTERLVFGGSKIAALKAMVSEKVENPTRVQILTAFVYKAVLSAKKSVSSGLPPTSLLQLINLRTRVEPPLPTTLTGNILTFFIASSTRREQGGEEETDQEELWSLVGDVKRNFEEFCEKFPKEYKAREWRWLHKAYAKEAMERWRNPGDDHVVYTCTSWCKFRVYDADFGWGKPIWITVPAFPIKNMILLMDAKDGDGIEVMVSLEKDEMIAFHQNQELLSFCTLS